MKNPRLLLLFCLWWYVTGNYTAHAGDVTIRIEPRLGAKALALNSATYTTRQGDTVTIDRLRFYLSSFVLTFHNGTQYKEKNSYHLIDAEEPSSYKIILKDVPAEKIVSISFNIGVDSAMSVSGAMDGDLDPAKGMYWAWNSGYINAKLEGACKSFNGKKSEPFEFHIGGYMGPEYALRSATVSVTEQAGRVIILSPNIAAWFDGWNRSKEKSIMIPGRAAMIVADRYSKMFNTPD